MFHPFPVLGVHVKLKLLGCTFQSEQATHFFVKILYVKNINKHVHREGLQYFNTGFFLQF